MRGDGYDLDAILSAINGNTRVVFIANPNNPTGTMLPPADVESFLDRVPERVTVVLDEAYADFAEYFARQRGCEYSRSLEYVRQGRNVVVLRTFSKAHGLAGLRVGYGFAPAALMAYFARMREVFSVTGIAEAAALAALDDSEHIRLALDNNAAGVISLTEGVSEMGLRVVPTWGNFLYIDVREDANTLTRRLQKEGVIIRPLNAWGAPSAIRVTVGTPEQNQRFLAAMRVSQELGVRS
jgi:histidinol-phosphate aminotransferase